MGGLVSSAGTREAILQVAGPVFADSGYEHATVREICSAAGVNVAAVNYYFGDKQQLYLESVKRAHEQRAHEIPFPHWSPGTPASDKLCDFVMTLARRMMGLDEASWQTRLLMREVLSPTAACASLVEDYFRPDFDLLLSILDELLPPDVPMHRRHKLAFSVVGQCFFYRAAGNVVSLMIPADELAHHYGIDELAGHIADTVVSTIAALRDCPVDLSPVRVAVDHPAHGAGGDATPKGYRHS